MRALIVNADVFMAASVKAALAEEDLICDTTDLGEDSLEIGKLNNYDIILLDLRVLKSKLTKCCDSCTRRACRCRS
jgi:DNA-binding response OmpR family regulator